MASTSWYLIASLPPEKRVLVEQGENNNPKWTLADMEKYMLGEEETTMALGLMPRHLKHGPEPKSPKEQITKPKEKPENVNTSEQQQNGNLHESAGEESSPSWASSSAGNTPSYGSGGTAFEFERPKTDVCDKLKTSATAPVITTTTCTPTSTPVNVAKKHMLTKSSLPKEPKCSLNPSLTKDLLEALDSDQDDRHESFFKRKSRKGSSGSVQDCSTSHSGTPSRGSRLSRLLRRTHSAGCSKEVPPHNSYNVAKMPVTKAKSADGAPCSREEEDVKKKNRKTLAQDMKMRLSFLRRRHTDSSLQPSSVRPSPEEAHKWAESFNELTNSKYGLSLFRAFLSREFSEENIEFWLACEDFKRTRGNKLSSKARKIYDDFVAVQSPKEVNLDANMRSAIYDRLNNPDRHSFDSAQRRIQGLMEQDAYIRFLQSELYTELLQCNNRDAGR